MKKIFYQSSLPRAGSTLMQNVLGQNPDFYVTPTSPMCSLMYSCRNAYGNVPEWKAIASDDTEEAYLEFLRHGMQGYFSKLTDRPCVVDKSRSWISNFNFLKTLHGEEPKMIYMVRDLRQIFASIEKKFRKNRHIELNIENYDKFENTTTPKRIDMWAKSPMLGFPLETLNEAIRQKINEKVMFVRYEDFLVNPEHWMNEIYDYLGVERFAHDFDNIEQVTHENDTIHGVFGDHKIRNKLEPINWDADEILGFDVCKWIVETYLWFFQSFGYVNIINQYLPQQQENQPQLLQENQGQGFQLNS
jgi:sulfotransferase